MCFKNVEDPLSTNRPKWVADLINLAGDWDKTIVQNCFNKNVAKDIIATHLPEIGTQDEIIWLQTSHGIYEVKSGYNVCRLYFLHLVLQGKVVLAHNPP